ncbi:4-hydroxy-tetrahydrodipicolinate reductase [Candidatus Woesearchaeota archaeon]|nr:4-hydroxy-tetrahydrodipicolinate reductase [Candidatus Woesearchaeota archaeon]
MKIAIIGYGQMGHEIEKAAVERSHEVVSTIDPYSKDARFSEISAESLAGVDVAIDFSHPSAVLGNIKKVSSIGTNLVVGTTGWYEHLEDVKSDIRRSSIGFIYSSNFSLGVNLFYSIVESAARIMNNASSYDVAGMEIHHSKKADSPSGTAKSIAEILLKNIGRKDKVSYDKMDGKIQPNELHFASLRAGSIPGTHKVIFDSAADTIELTHTARSRQGFALGAVLAAEFVKGKKGLFTVSDMMEELIK